MKHYPPTWESLLREIAPRLMVSIPPNLTIQEITHDGDPGPNEHYRRWETLTFKIKWEEDVADLEITVDEIQRYVRRVRQTSPRADR